MILTAWKLHLSSGKCFPMGRSTGIGSNRIKNIQISEDPVLNAKRQLLARADTLANEAHASVCLDTYRHHYVLDKWLLVDNTAKRIVLGNTGQWLANQTKHWDRVAAQAHLTPERQTMCADRINVAHACRLAQTNR